MAVGDTVLFHVRDGERVATFPPMEATDFAHAPDLVSTQPQSVDPTMKVLRRAGGDVREGDVLLVATDAVAAWMLRRHGRGCRCGISPRARRLPVR